MDAAFSAYLERVLAHRAALGESMEALRAALEVPERGDLWRRRVRAGLTELAHDLRDHVALTEREDGLYADLRTRAPRLAALVETQLADHAWFLGEVDRLIGDRDSGQAGTDSDKHRQAVGELLDRLARHRRRGVDLVYQAYEVDLGGSG